MKKISYPFLINPNVEFPMLTQSSLNMESIDNQSVPNVIDQPKEYYNPMDQLEPISLVMYGKDCYDPKYENCFDKPNNSVHIEPIIKTSRRNLQFKKYKY